MLVAASPPPSFDPQQFIDQNVKQCGNGIALKCNIRGTVDSIKGLATAPIDAMFQKIADMITGGVDWILQATLLWWIDSPVQVSLEKNQTSIERMRGYLAYMALAVLVGGLMVQGIRMSIQRRADPAVRAARALVTYAVTGCR